MRAGWRETERETERERERENVRSSTACDVVTNGVHNFSRHNVFETNTQRVGKSRCVLSIHTNQVIYLPFRPGRGTRERGGGSVGEKSIERER